MKFAVDCMLGKLAKWLKILGFDAAYFSKIEDDELLRLARMERRTLLTRDTGLMERAAPHPALFILSGEWENQVKEVLTAFGLHDQVALHSRCLVCNRKLKLIAKSRARNLVTPHVYAHAAGFALCPGCGRVFWKGTHSRDMEAKLAEILGRSGN
jgi:hypothetical protein